MWTCLYHRVCAPAHALSQLITSFVASESLGIPRVPLLTSWCASLPKDESDSYLLARKPAAKYTLFSLLLPYVKERLPSQSEGKREAALRRNSFLYLNDGKDYLVSWSGVSR